MWGLLTAMQRSFGTMPKRTVLMAMVSLILVGIPLLDAPASRCEKRATVDLVEKYARAERDMFTFMSLWATQFVAPNPHPHDSPSQIAKFAAENAQASTAALTIALFSSPCSSWATAKESLAIAAFVLNGWALLGLRRNVDAEIDT